MLTTTVCVALSAAGLAIALLTAYRRRFLTATRIAAVALIPVGLAMAGLAKLAGRIGRAVGDWAAGLVFQPSVWAGFAVLALSVVLFVIARIAGRHTSRREPKPAAGERATSAPVAGRGAAGRGGEPPALGTRRTGDSPPASGSPRGSDRELEDLQDIEAILKKHGI